MSTTQALRPARKMRRLSFITLAIVGALHIVVIYGLYFGLTGQVPRIIFMATPSIVVPVTPTKPPPISDPTHVQMFQPQVAFWARFSPVRKSRFRVIDISRETMGSRFTNYGPGNPPISNSPLPVIVAARGMAGKRIPIPDYPLRRIRLGRPGM